jgi:hypothetical protein
MKFPIPNGFVVNTPNILPCTEPGEHHFKCPLCNNLQEFSGEMQRLGIYLPQRDALAWNEQENNASFDVSSGI